MKLNLKTVKPCLLLVLWLLSVSAYAIIKPLPVDQAFQLKTQSTQQQVDLNWHIASNYYLYRDRFQFRLLPSNTDLKPRALPKAIQKTDPFAGQYGAYAKQLALIIDLPTDYADKQLEIGYQGCSEAGFCYPPQTRLVQLNPTQISLAGIWNSARNGTAFNIKQLFTAASLPLIVIMFLGFGLLLTFTPCVLPMIPIVSSVIVGHGKKLTSRKALGLSSVYVLSMAATYALLGVAFAWFGKNIQMALQTPLALSFMVVLFVLMALALFDVFTLKLPGFLTSRLVHLGQRQHGGTYSQALILGFLATVMVSPCITPPLVGALSYIAQTGNLVLGGSALFALGVGMGIPLILIVTVGSKMLPKTGAWMQAVKIFFGLLLLAVAIDLISRFAAEFVTELLWTGLLLLTAVFLGRNKQRLLAIVCIAAALWMGFTAYQTQRNAAVLAKSQRDKITSVAALNQQLQQAQANGQNVILDFYADWCISCKVLEKRVFADAGVKDSLKKNNTVIIKVDITANNQATTALLNTYDVIAPPTLIFINRNGEEIENARVIGEIDRKRFIAHVQRFL